MKLIAALLLSAVHAKLAPVHLAKKSGVKAVQAIDLGGGKKASGGYGQWAKDNAAANGIIIGAFKTAAADLMAQVSDSESDFDLKRNLLFFAFGGAYLGAFQYWLETAWKSTRHRRDVKTHSLVDVHAGTRSTSSSASSRRRKDSPPKAWRRS